MMSRLRSFPFLLFLHLFLIGFAVSVIAFIILRQYTLVTGEHMIALSILLGAFFLNMAGGSRFFGRRSDRISHVAGLTTLMELGIVLYALANPALVTAFEKTMLVLTQHSLTGPFRVSLYRFLLLVVFLSPMAFAGGLIPVFSKYMIRHVSHVGRKSGTVFAMTSMGALAGSCVVVLYLIPRYGYAISLLISSLLLLLNAVIFRVHHAWKADASVEHPIRSMAMKVRKSGMTVLKNRFVIETETKLIRTLRWVFAIEGFAAMSFVILWTRTLSDLFRSDITSVFSFVAMAVFSGLAAGSLLFKGLADRPRKRFYLFGLFEIMTGISAALSLAGLYLVLSSTGNETAMVLSHSGSIHRKMILTGLLVFLPALFTGASLPLACRLYPKRIQRIGRRIGWLGFVFLIGAMISLFLTSFILVPLLGVYTTFFLFVILTILIGLILILRDSRIKRAFRLVILVLAIMSILLVQSIFRHQGTSIHANDLMQQDTIRAIREGSTATVMLIDRTDGYSELMVNGNAVLQTDRANLRVQQLLAYLPWLFSGGTEQAFLGGYGLGVTASSLEKCGFNKIVISESSPEVIALTSSTLTELNNDILTNQAVSISIEDSRGFLHQSPAIFDIITFSYALPQWNSSHFSREFYELCFDHLAENGAMCQSLPLSWYGSPAFYSMLKTCSGVFADVSLWHTGTDLLLLLAARDRPSRDFCALKEKFDRLNADQKMTQLGMSSTEAMLSCLIMDDSHIREMSENDPEITDNLPRWAMGLQEKSPVEEIFPDFSAGESVSYPDWIDLSGSCVASGMYTLNIIESYKKILLGAPLQ